ncbi:tannase/feruloyl esterase family alpha/beta hydrolase [Streptacidiphilus sp. MAP12-16]|uniref:tannase/feruloyl esterase family alpha/beta hydrolase n=1 Tax=Streptacidiphilus sp. MAP12-16 TaxID=3156300 RepID=UPI0035175460
MAWAGTSVPVNGQSLRPFPDSFLSNAAYPIGTPGSSVDTFQFTAKALHQLTPAGVDGNAMSLDLSSFRRAGGKLIIWDGWADQTTPPAGMLDYYQRLSHPSARQQDVCHAWSPGLQAAQGQTRHQPCREVALSTRSTHPQLLTVARPRARRARLDVRKKFHRRGNLFPHRDHLRADPAICS